MEYRQRTQARIFHDLQVAIGLLRRFGDVLIRPWSPNRSGDHVEITSLLVQFALGAAVEEHRVIPSSDLRLKPATSNNIIQKGLAFAREQSGNGLEAGRDRLD